MALLLSQHAVNSIDWAVVGLSFFCFFSGVIGAAYTMAYSWPKQCPAAKEFNYLWRSRFLSQVLAALYALSEMLRLQVLWGPQSVLVSGGYQTALMCRLFTAITFGFLEPSFLLLALFSCVYSVQGRSSSPHPNSNIVFFALGLSLPFCAAQVVSAVFTQVFDLNYGLRISYTFFSTFSTERTDYCLVPAQPSQPGIPVFETSANCDFCVFPLLSTLISAGFATFYLLVAWRVTARIASAVINKVLIRRMRILQLCVGILLPISVACRGVTVLFQPFELGFEILRLANVVCTAGTILSISVVLVLQPTHDAYVTDKNLKMHHLQGGWPKAGPRVGFPGNPGARESTPVVVETANRDRDVEVGREAGLTPRIDPLPSASSSPQTENVPLVNKS